MDGLCAYEGVRVVDLDIVSAESRKTYSEATVCVCDRGKRRMSSLRYRVHPNKRTRQRTIGATNRAVECGSQLCQGYAEDAENAEEC